MNHKLRPTPAMAVALTALVAAASGTAIANTTDTTPHAKAAAVRGPRGPQGPRGPKGSPGILAIRTVDSPHVTLQPDETTYDADPNGFQATCPAGYRVIGTGFDGGIGNTDFVLSYDTFVGGFMHNDTTVPLSDVHLQAICALLASSDSASRASVTTDRGAYIRVLRSLNARAHKHS